MRTVKWLALNLAFCLCLGACAATEPAAQTAPEPAASQEPASVPEETPVAEPAEPEVTGTPQEGDWEATLDGMYERNAANQVKFAPKVTELSNGVRIQRTPYDATVYNTRILKADERGCAACHTDLAAALKGMDSFTQGSYYEHFDFTNELGIETTYRQCYVCHMDGTWLDEFQPLMHGIHDSEAFQQMGGDCWSCHYVDDETNEMVLWDSTKYEVLRGISVVANVEGEFRFDQDVLTSDLFALNWMFYDMDYERVSKHFAGLEPDPAEDGIFDEWTITVEGDVENKVSFTLSELIASGPVVQKVSTMQCALNPLGGPFIENVEITGIPIAYVLEQAGLKEGANLFYCGFEDNMGYIEEISALEEHPAYLVYEINGKPVPYQNGYPVTAWFEDATAADGRKQCTTIRVLTGDAADYGAASRGTVYPDGTYDNKPNVALCHLSDGQVIDAAQPYTFEGYAHGFGTRIDAIEISFDRGATWSRFDTSASTLDRWVYWYFTWTPAEPGSYVISVRAVGEDGLVTADPVQKLINVQ